MKLSFSDKVVVVTGAACSLGKAVVTGFHAAGATVVVTDIAVHEGRSVAESLSRNGGRACFESLDVRDDAQWAAVMAKINAQYSGIDVLVNNAGIEICVPLQALDGEQARRVFDINVVGVALGLKHGLRNMRPGGSIINIASAAAITATPGMAIYAASKAAVERLTKVAAVEAGMTRTGIRANCVMPGGIEGSGMLDQLLAEWVAAKQFPDVAAAREFVAAKTPTGRCATLSEVARAVRYLASDESASINGVNLVVDGGMHLG